MTGDLWLVTGVRGFLFHMAEDFGRLPMVTWGSFLGFLFPTLEPVAAIGHPPAKDADGNGSQQRPQDGQGEVRNQSEHYNGSPEDLALHFIILARAGALRPPVKVRVSRKNTCQDKMGEEKSKPRLKKPRVGQPNP